MSLFYIPIRRNNLIQCDNPKCNYVIPDKGTELFVDVSEYIDKPCPKCNENLLTQQDFLIAEKFDKVLKFVNKWFGIIVSFRRGYFPDEEIGTQISFHKKFKVKSKL